MALKNTKLWQRLQTFTSNKVSQFQCVQVVVGESFGIDMTYDLDSLFFYYFLGTVGCLVWRCSPA